MVQIFRKNWFVFTLLLFPYAILIRLWVFFNTPDWPIDTESQSLVYQYIKNYLPSDYVVNVMLASFVIFINGVQINNIVIKNRITREINLFPGMIYILLSAIHKDMFWLSPHLLGITFLLISVSNIFRIYQKPHASLYIFNAGFFLGLASIFYPPYLFFLLFVFISILILRKLNFRDIIQMGIGFSVVFFFASFFRFWNNGDYTPFLDLVGQFNIDFSFGKLQLYEWGILLLIITLVIIAIINYRKYTIKKSIQSQKKVNLIYWHLTISVFCLFFALNNLLFPSLLLLFISVSILTAMLMNRLKNETALELIHLFILFFIIFSHFWF